MTAPLCNTGVHPPTGHTDTAHQSRFDWYRATVPISLEMLTKVCEPIAGQYPKIEDGAGRFNYRRSRTISNCGVERAATILFGGPNGHPNVEASGDYADKLAAVLRAGGAHRVTRCDIAVDLYGEGLYPELKGMAESLSDAHRIECREVSNRNPTKGNTTYLGSRKSSVFARIYEKGKADRGKYEPELEDFLLEKWVRIELEVKPQKEMRERAASIEPAAFWGVSAWTAQLAEEAFDMAPEPIPFHPRRTATDDRAFQFMCAQYRNLLQRRCEGRHNGDRDALAREIVETVFGSENASAA